MCTCIPSLLILRGQRRQANTLSPDTQGPLITWFQYIFLLAWKSFSPQLFKKYHISSNQSEIKWLTPYWISEGFAEKKITELNSRRKVLFYWHLIGFFWLWSITKDMFNFISKSLALVFELTGSPILHNVRASLKAKHYIIFIFISPQSL